MSPAACPSCKGPMERRELERRPQGMLELDMCFACHGIWFDQYESAQLAPRGVMELFRQIHEHQDQPARPLAQKTTCPRCRDTLLLTHDVQGTNKITYFRCAQGHGRLTTFFQFLREKQFVRSLADVEIRQLQATVKQVRCSSCGGPVAVERDGACPYCRAPLSILDADAVKRALAQLDAADRRMPRRPDPQGAVDQVLAGNRSEASTARPAFEHRLNRGARPSAAMPTLVGAEGGTLIDLVGEALDFLMSQ